jgi:hypothetical protein
MILDRHSSKILEELQPSHSISETQKGSGEYISGLKYFQQHSPTLPVLICGIRGNRLAVFMYEYIEDDFKERPLHAAISMELNFDKYRYQGHYCIPYSDEV